MAAVLILVGAASQSATAAQRGKSKKGDQETDPFAEFVWPPPPDKPRIKLDTVLLGRRDVEAGSRLARILIGASPASPWDNLSKPFAVGFDSKGRILVTDTGSHALLRIDLTERRWDVFGTQGAIGLKSPLGMTIGPDDVVYVADVGSARVIAFDPDGGVHAIFGKPGELTNPTDAALSPDGSRLFVTDSKEHRIVVFATDTAEVVGRFGELGSEPGQFHYPTSLAFAPTGELFVVDQLNARVQMLTPTGDAIDQFGELQVGFGGFVRPKDIAVDESGLIYVTDNAFNNFQIFDSDFSLLTFVGSGGSGPGKFNGLSGIAVRGNRIAAVDQLGHRLQVFHYLVPKTAD